MKGGHCGVTLSTRVLESQNNDIDTNNSQLLQLKKRVITGFYNRIQGSIPGVMGPSDAVLERLNARPMPFDPIKIERVSIVVRPEY